MFDNNNETLMHCDTYLGLDFSDGIKHWKYIKKERKNGRWVYFYDDAEGRDLERKSIEAGITSAVNKYNYEQAKENTKYQYNKNRGKTMSSKEADKHFLDVAKAANTERKARSEYYDSYAKAKAADYNYDKYNKKTAVKRATQYVLAKTLNSASASVAKGKSLFKKLFKIH